MLKYEASSFKTRNFLHTPLVIIKSRILTAPLLLQRMVVGDQDNILLYLNGMLFFPFL